MRIYKDSEFNEARRNNPIVAELMDAGGTPLDCVVALAKGYDRLAARVSELEAIAPRKYRRPDGSCILRRCPEDLVPEGTLIPEEYPEPESVPVPVPKGD